MAERLAQHTTGGLRFQLQRTGNALRRFAAGLGLRGECVWPGVHNDLFVAHASIYHFFARYAAGRRVLDAGCGTGYGSRMLLDAGAATVLGVDLDRRHVRYARRHFRHPRLRFEVADCQRLTLAPASLDLVVSSNAMEHLDDPAALLRAAAAALVPGGFLLVVVPVITNEFLLAANRAIPYHRSNLFVDQWLELFSTLGWSVAPFRHVCRPGMERLDFASPFPSTLRAEDFDFPAADRDALYLQPTLGGVYLLYRGARPASRDDG